MRTTKILIVSGAVALVLVLTACGSTPQSQAPSPAAGQLAASHVEGLPTKAESSGAAREVYRASSVAELVKLSDLVIVGTVVAIAPGRSAGADVGGRLQWRDIAVDVEEVIHGEFTADMLNLEELGWKEGVPTTINNASWAQRGDRMLLGLKRTDNGVGIAGPRYVLTSTSTKFYLRTDGTVDHNYDNREEVTEFVSDAASRRVEQLLDEVRAQR